tara:strand:+ start:457 stop:672 length:216 start_codon:yes stop_codon:yes gene_type:complete
MAKPINKFMAVEINVDGWPVGNPQYFATRPDAADGSKDMIRKALPGHSVYIYKVAARLDATITYDLVMENN